MMWPVRGRSVPCVRARVGRRRSGSAKHVSRLQRSRCLPRRLTPLPASRGGQCIRALGSESLHLRLRQRTAATWRAPRAGATQEVASCLPALPASAGRGACAQDCARRAAASCPSGGETRRQCAGGQESDAKGALAASSAWSKRRLGNATARHPCFLRVALLALTGNPYSGGAVVPLSTK